LHAGASAVVGPRWHVPDASARLFARCLHEAVRAGAAVGEAVRLARLELRQAVPHRADWLAFAHFGHPLCRPYLVRPARGFTLFEALDHPDDQPFRAGQAYRFRASYRAEAPVWFDGPLRARPAPADDADVSVLVAPLDGSPPRTYALEPVAGGEDRQCVAEIVMPQAEGSLPVLVRFQRGGDELRTLTLTLDVAEAR
jgi:hypothetical protein